MEGKKYGTLLTFAVVFVLVLVGLPLPGIAQVGHAQFDAQLQLTRSVIQAERKAIVALNMELTDQESAEFWPLYNDYWAERSKLNDRFAKLLANFAQHYVYDSLSDEKAGEMIDESLSLDKAELKLMRKYVKKFRKILPETKVLRYFQIENKLDAIIDMELAGQIPLARPTKDAR